MVSLEDIISFMKQDKGDRVNQREQDKEDRAKQREQDMLEMKELIMNGVHKEVEAAVLPIKERQLHIEQEQVIMKEQLSNLFQEIEKVKEKMEFPQLPSTKQPRLAPLGSPKYSSLEKTIVNNLHKAIDRNPWKTRQIATETRKILGLNKITKEDVERVSRISGAQDEDSAYLATAKEYFSQEIRIGEDIFNSLNVKQVFPPAKENWDTLYVVFESKRDVNTIYNYARNLQKNQRLVRYIPHQFYERYRAMEADAYLLRHSESKFKTRIKMGINDLVLYKRQGSESWSTVSCSSEWPAVNLIDEQKN
jgi:hypothetical protein